MEHALDPASPDTPPPDLGGIKEECLPPSLWRRWVCDYRSQALRRRERVEGRPEGERVEGGLE